MQVDLYGDRGRKGWCSAWTGEEQRPGLKRKKTIEDIVGEI